MKIFVLASYSSKVDYISGKVFPEYRDWLEAILTSIEAVGHEVFCALRADQYKINVADPAVAFELDMEQVEQSNAILALLGDAPSAGVQTEIGVGIALKKIVILAHTPEDRLAYFNAAMLRAGVARELLLPLDDDKLRAALQ